MKNCLLIDFGSTFTKLTAVDLLKQEIMASSMDSTTVETDIKEGYHKALENLYSKLGEPIKFEKVIACSSAAGGLKMAAIGLVEELTVEAAKRVCLGAGAKVELVFSHHLSDDDIKQITSAKIDIILVAGGTDGGNSETVIYNVKKIAKAKIKIPIIYAGNKSAKDTIKAIFEKNKMNGYLCENVMPKLNVLNIDSAKDTIRDIFLQSIIYSKGIKKIEEEIDQVILPTPKAVLNGALLLSKGYLDEEGLGDILLFDVGGATTDVYSLGYGTPTKSDVILRGLEEPFAKRTVEGDLGMRYSALGVLATLSEKERHHLALEGIKIENECRLRHENVNFLPKSEHDYKVEAKIASICINNALSRHVGKIEPVYTVMGLMHAQQGKDLSNVNYVIGTGGVLINAKMKKMILQASLPSLEAANELRPLDPKFLIDQDYILSAMGLLSTFDPMTALKIMKKHLKPIEG